MDLLWEGKVAEVLVELEQSCARGEAVEAALSYYTEHQTRLDYATYRARGLQIGSGSVESACKQLVTARLKQAGMIWDAAGAEAVAAVRAWLKSERWQEAMALRTVGRRGYRRQGADRALEERQAERPAVKEQASGKVEPRAKAPQQGMPAEVLTRVQAELAAQRGKHGWGKAWSVQRQREMAAQRAQSKPVSTA